MRMESRKRATGDTRLFRRYGWPRAWAAAVLALLLSFGAWTGTLAADGETEADPAGAPTPAQVDEALRALQSSIAQAEPFTDWAAFALARGGQAAQQRYFALAGKTVTEGSLRLATDYARAALAINANGGDARKAGPAGLDLLGRLARLDNLAAEGPNAPAFALMALDAGGYVFGSQDKWSRDALIQWLVEQRADGGGWSHVPGRSDVELTGIVLTALAPYKDREDVKPAVEEALAWLSSVQLPNGGFGRPETSEAAVQAIIALVSLDIDPANDPRFVKNGHSALSRLFGFRLPDGSFSHLPGGKPDSLASLYALLGLTAVDRWQDGLPGLYAGLRFGSEVKVSVYGPAGRLAQGTGNGRTAMEDLVQVLRRNHVAYTLKRDPQDGVILTSVGSFENGAFGGDDGWRYAVRKSGEWVRDVPGLSAYDPAGAAEIVVYYGGESPDLIHSVKTEPVSPREGQPIRVTVEKETYDPKAGKSVTAPAEGANVTIGGVSAVTDKDGTALLKDVKAGETSLRVDGYKAGALPSYVTSEQPFTVGSYVKRVTVRVEGDQGPIAQGSAEGGTALEALEYLLASGHIPYETEEISSSGKSISSIKGISKGQYGGSDGWTFAVKGSAGWIEPSEGIGTFLLEEGQEVVVYYGGESTRLLEPVSVAPARVKPGEPVTVTVTYRDRTAGKLAPAKPLAGVRVEAAGVAAVTDDAGRAVLQGLPEGVHRVTVSGYSSDRAPTVVRATARAAVAGDYADQAQIPGWAADWVREARASGVLLGEGDSKDAPFQPKAAVTRAEFVVSLVRALGTLPPASGGTAFRDVPADAWYAKEIEAAAQAGLVSGTAPGVFAPDAQLTREQAALLLVRALNIKTAHEQPISDLPQVAAGAVSAVQAVVEQGWMTTQPDGKFLPKMTMPREQAAVIAVRVLQQVRYAVWGE
ncbi:S-layer homology domain-containing protein [Cohnella caldifontis]|uniref:S-layer homology domain-containing protein n=1 Tax=Cohnella caldifontis TaxID=3027471 RepID=UPI0023EDFD53|nr:S-layer homology domain-containing protein [Cohnella sp. YIM B05605]